MYPVELDIKDTTESNTSAPYLVYFCRPWGTVNFTSIYDKCGDFNFHNFMTNFPFTSSNIRASPAHGVFLSQLIWYPRAWSSYGGIIPKGKTTFKYMKASRTWIRQRTFIIVVEAVLWSIRGSYQTIWSSSLRNAKWYGGLFTNMCPFDYTVVLVSGTVKLSWTGLTTPVGLTVVTPTDRPKLVRNRCVIEDFWWRFSCCHDAFWIFFSVGVGTFVIGLSQISSIFLFCNLTIYNDIPTSIRLYTNPWPVYRTRPFTGLWEVSIEHLRRV